MDPICSMFRRVRPAGPGQFTGGRIVIPSLAAFRRLLLRCTSRPCPCKLSAGLVFAQPPFSCEVPLMTSRRAVVLLSLGLAMLPGSPALEGEAPARPRAFEAKPKEKKPEGPETPIGPKWWPSEWGAGDERGAANRMTPERALAAAKLIRTGKVYSLGRVYEHGMPLPGKRHFSLTIPGRPTGGPDGKNRGVYNEEMFSGEIGQIGTQLDGLGHVGVRMGRDDYFYNGHKLSEFGTARGLEKLGIEKVGVFFTRGVLIDVAAYRKVPRMKTGEVITVEDLTGALKAQKVEVKEGDVVLLRTGHGKLWMKDNETYGKGEPGI